MVLKGISEVANIPHFKESRIMEQKAMIPEPFLVSFGYGNVTNVKHSLFIVSYVSQDF